MSDGGGRMTDVGRQGTDGRGQMLEDRNQKSADR